MKKKSAPIYLLYLLLCLGCQSIHSIGLAQRPQDSLPKAERFQVAVLMPLFLDSAFDSSLNYRYNKTIPSFIATGLDYFIGLQQAMDSLKADTVPVDIHVFDSRNNELKPDVLVLGDTLKKMHLIAGMVNVNEAAVLARFAKTHQIPFINLNLPNEAGSTGNPYHIIINPTLATHCQSIYKFIQYNHALSPVILLTKKGTQEERVRNYLQEAGMATASVPLQIKTLDLEDSLSIEKLTPMLDSNKKNICIIGSLDIQFSMSTCSKLATLAGTYPIQAIGMPTWDQLPFSKVSFKGLEMTYTSSFFTDPEEKVAKQIRQDIFARYYIRAKDISLRIYEILNVLCRLRPSNGSDLLEQFSHTSSTQWGQLNIQAVRNKKTGQVDYNENKKIVFVTKLNGITQSVE